MTYDSMVHAEALVGQGEQPKPAAGAAHALACSWLGAKHGSGKASSACPFVGSPVPLPGMQWRELAALAALHGLQHLQSAAQTRTCDVATRGRMPSRQLSGGSFS